MSSTIGWAVLSDEGQWVTTYWKEDEMEAMRGVLEDADMRIVRLEVSMTGYHDWTAAEECNGTV